MVLEKVSVLKIDKDCHVDPDWISYYLLLVVFTCLVHGLKVVSVKMCDSPHKGIHFYIEITPPVNPMVALKLEWMLGDDALRTDMARARLESGHPHWDRLFEKAGTRPRTIYRAQRDRPHQHGHKQASLDWLGLASH